MKSWDANGTPIPDQQVFNLTFDELLTDPDMGTGIAGEDDADWELDINILKMIADEIHAEGNTERAYEIKQCLGSIVPRLRQISIK